MKLTYRDKIFKMLYDLPYNTDFIIEDNVSEHNRELFLSEVIDYIRCDYDNLYGYEIQISKTKTKLRKV